MGLLSSLFSRSPAPEAAADGDSVDNLAQARTRARQRLMGAVVLVGIGIIGFPLLFETQPRPIAVDVPIEIPRKENAAPLSLPSARAPASKAPATPPPEADRPADRVAKAAAPIITETAAEAGLTAARPAASAPKPATKVDDKPVAVAAATKPEPKPDAKPPVRSESRPEPKAEAKAEPKAEPKPAATPSAGDAARAQALLDGKAQASAPAGATRYIVQIGAFADPVLARQTRLKVEKLGLVTYTHVAKTPDGERTRVRVGPVASRDEAEKMAAKIKAAGLSAAILTL